MPKKSVKETIVALVRFLKAHNDPHEIALGVAIGSFIAILPLYGLHTALCVIAAILIFESRYTVLRPTEFGVLIRKN